jgi:hypothetical protein
LMAFINDPRPDEKKPGEIQGGFRRAFAAVASRT